MSYIKYILILAHTLFRKVFGLVWFFVAVPFRGWSRNSMYNYILSNGLYLERLYERTITEEDDRWVIHPYHGTDGGYIKKRKVTWLEYQFNLWFVWGWLDDDANEDTYSYSHMLRRYTWWSKDRPLYGNSFDLGDKRAEHPSFDLVATTIWNVRNTAYNFRYMQFEKHKDDKNLFLYTVGKWQFGWEQDKKNSNNYSLVFLGWN